MKIVAMMMAMRMMVMSEMTVAITTMTVTKVATTVTMAKQTGKVVVKPVTKLWSRLE